MPSARKRAARSPTPRGPAGASRDADLVSPPHRRGLIAAGVLLAAIIIGGGVWLMRGRPAQADLHPVAGQNVLLITIDTLRADAMSSYGGPAATPALDRLAAGGVRFTFAHAHAVLTLPSHASIFTGEYPYQHGVRENSGYRLAPGARTIATLLKGAGYATGAFVGAFPVHSRFGLNQGFDVYDDRFGETRAPTEFVMPERPAAAVVPLARDWIAQHRDGRWFVWVHVFDPHAPYQPPPPFDRQYAGRPYYGEVAATDAALAPLLDDVRSAARPTLVVVTGDHGESLGEHGEASHGLFAYEATLRVPLIIAEVGPDTRSVRLPRAGVRNRQPDQTGEISDVPVRHIDILPTILDAIGQPTPSGLPGRTLLPAAERRAGAAPRSSYFEAMSAMLNRGWAPLTGVVADRDKFIDLPIPELYDLQRDPGEQRNLEGQTPERERVLQADLRGFGAQLPGERAREDPEALARLRALGYVSGRAPAKAHYTEADDPKRLVDIAEAIHRGVDLYSAGRFDEAIQVYRQVIARRPDMALAYKHLAFVEWQQGNPRGALDVLQQAIRSGVTAPTIVTQLGSYLSESGRPDQAVRILEPLAKDSGADGDTLNALGIAYAQSGHPAEAARIFERVLAQTPDSGIALANLGVLALQRGDMAAARQAFEHAIQVDPHSSQAFGGLGVVFVRAGDLARAVDAWKQAYQLDATNFDALYNIGTTLARDGQRDAARPYLQEFVRVAPPAFYAKDIRDISELLKLRP